MKERLDNEEFLCEEIQPVAGSFLTEAMARGEPGVPGRFVWRGAEYRTTAVVKQWKTTGPCRHGSGEVYLRRHWCEVATDPPAVFTIYCDRQAKDRKHPKRRWFAYTVAAL